MPIPPYPIYCYGKDCPNEAVYKVAARWSDGVRSELKTYGLACPDCLEQLFRTSREKQRIGRLAPNETLEPVGIYDLTRGQRDKELRRREDLEARYQEGPGT